MLSRRQFFPVLGAASAAPAILAQKRRLNVLFFAVDDLRPDIGCYGNRRVHTPNIDALASRGTVFERAYCQQAVCSPSRTSLLTGRRPDTTQIYELQTHFRKFLPDVVTLPEHFKNNGYTTTGLSKLFHGGLNDAQSWSIAHWTPNGPAWGSPENEEAARRQTARLREAGWRQPAPKVTRQQRGPAWSAPDVDDDSLGDGKTAAQAVAALEKLKDQTFFLGVGFLKPHLPFVAPKRYYDLYPKEKIDLVDYPDIPKGVPPIALHANGELRSYEGVPDDGPIPHEMKLELIRGYYAAASYTDAQIGRVLRQLDKLGLRDNTIVVLWGDHGWHLDNHGLWHKHTNFEKAVRAPLVFSMPGQRRPGNRTRALSEFVDIYPSLCEAAGLKLSDGLEGSSFVPLLDRPDQPWKKAAFSQYPRQAQGAGRVMGYSMRTDRYRYTEWQGSNYLERELYDYQKDPNESVNLAAEKGQEKLVESLSAQLKAGWRGALPSASTGQRG